MTKDEYTKSLQKWEDDNAQIDDDYISGYSVALQDVIDLAEKLDEPKKVVIPQIVASWIEEAAQPSNLDTISVMYSDAIRYGKHIDWLKNHDNQRLLLKALLYGYEVEKEKKYLVRIKGICQGNQWLDYEVVGDKRYFELNTESEKYKTYFTKQWLKDHWSEYDAYNNAGLLEFEEVEDE